MRPSSLAVAEQHELRAASHKPHIAKRHHHGLKGNLTTYTYDGFDRLAKTSFPSTTAPGQSSSSDFTSQSYDPATWDMIQERRRDGQIVNYTYDGRGRVTAKDQPSTTYAYDNLDRLTSTTQAGRTVGLTYDGLGRVISASGPMGAVGYEYNLAGDRTRITWPDNYYVTYDWTTAHELSAVREYGATSGAGVLATYAYDDFGRRTSITRGNGVVTSYSAYDPLSRLSTLAQNLTGSTNDLTLTFSYNPASQITSKTATTGNNAYHWNGLYNVDRTYTPNALNQLTTVGSQTLTYDARGNLQNDGAITYGYDIDNRLTSTSTGATVAYDPLSRVHQLTSGSGVITRFAYDGVNLIAEFDSAGTLIHRYVHGADADEPLVWYQGAGTASRRWLIADQLGSVVAAADGSGAPLFVNSYDEYGVPSTNNQGRFQYTGQTWISELALYNYKGRFYSPHLGRFLQTDPLGYDDGLNLYAYVDNDPVNNVDPNGLKGTPRVQKPRDANPTPVDEVVVPGRRNRITAAFLEGLRRLGTRSVDIAVRSTELTIRSFADAAKTTACSIPPLKGGGERRRLFWIGSKCIWRCSR